MIELVKLLFIVKIVCFKETKAEINVEISVKRHISWPSIQIRS